jgi:hydroxymethylglutaryl-CoA reductase (NADPH)
MTDTWRRSVIGHLHAHSVGFNAQYANGLAAIFIACGQDVANVANAAVGVTDFEAIGDGDLHVSVTLPSLTVATVGGGTALGTSRECLSLLGCSGSGLCAEIRRDRGGDPPGGRNLDGGGDRQRRVRGRP